MLIVFFLIVVTAEGVTVRETNSEEFADQRRSREAAKRLTDVVSLAFCESSVSAEDNKAKKTLKEVHTYAELKDDPRASLPDSFTMCSTIMTISCPSLPMPAFSTILDNDRAQFLAPVSLLESTVNALKIFYLEGASEEVVGKIPPLFPNQWTRSCMAINTTSGLIHWVVEGTLVLTSTSEKVKRGRPKDLSKKLVLGARSYAGLWEAPSSKVTNLNIFSSPLSIEKMESITGGARCLEEGDYLAWRDMEWILHGQARIETVDKEEPCKGEPLVNLFYTPFPGMDSCMRHCHNLGTRAPSVTSLQDWTKLQNSLKITLYNKGLNTLELWLPVDDRRAEGEWRDAYTEGVMQNYTIPWAGSGPDGGRRQNCAYLVDGDRWGDTKCDSISRACMCTHKPSSYLEFQGLCQESAIDAVYKLSSDLTDSRKLKLQGLVRTSISYDDEEGIWILNARDSNMTGISRASHASFTLGKHNWTIKGDKGCNGGKPYVTELKMSGCQKGNFTCNDGQCVSMDQRCNQLPDCRDKSDERNCDILLLEEGYNKNVPPINSTAPVNVSISIDLMKLVDIAEEDYSIEIQFEIMLKWKENRATYHNLKKIDALNTLTQDDIERLWLPEVIYENTNQKESTRLGTWKTSIVVKREEENGVMSGSEFVDETEVFSGSENCLIMNQTYTHTFQCNYELSHYPFDTQVCTVTPNYSNSSCCLSVTKNRITSPLTVFLKYGQLDLYKASNSINIFLNTWL